MIIKPKFSSFYFYLIFTSIILMIVWIPPFLFSIVLNESSYVINSIMFWIIFLFSFIPIIISILDYKYRFYKINSKIVSNGFWEKYIIDKKKIKDVDVVETLPDIIFSTKSIKINDKYYIYSIKKSYKVMKEIVGG